MEFVINGENQKLKFSFGFIRAMDEVYKIEQYGLRMGMGVSMAYNALDMFSVGDLPRIIKAAVVGNPTLNQVEEAIEQYAEENDGLEDLFKGLKDELGKSPMTKVTVKNFKENLPV